MNKIFLIALLCLPMTGFAGDSDAFNKTLADAKKMVETNSNCDWYVDQVGSYTIYTLVDQYGDDAQEIEYTLQDGTVVNAVACKTKQTSSQPNYPTHDNALGGQH